MQSRYAKGAGPLEEVGRFEWERIVLQCHFPMQNTKLVALTVATYADTKTGQNIYPGQRRLAAHTGISERRVRDHLQELERFGLINLQVKGSSFGRGGKGMASKYQLCIPAGLLVWHSEIAQDDLDMWDLDKPDGGHAAKEDRTLVSGDTDHEDGETPDVHDRTPDVADISPDSSDTNTGQQRPPTSSLPLHETNPNQSNPHSNFAAASPSVTRARQSLDNSQIGSFSEPSMDDGRRRQALEEWGKSMGKEKAS